MFAGQRPDQYPSQARRLSWTRLLGKVEPASWRDQAGFYRDRSRCVGNQERLIRYGDRRLQVSAVVRWNQSNYQCKVWRMRGKRSICKSWRGSEIIRISGTESLGSPFCGDRHSQASCWWPDRSIGYHSEDRCPWIPANDRGKSAWIDPYQCVPVGVCRTTFHLIDLVLVWFVHLNTKQKRHRFQVSLH